MKILYTLLLFISSSVLIQAQNATITIGRGTNCFGRGLCSITNTNNERSQEYNTSFIQIDTSIIVLRIYRDKLSKDQLDRIFGKPITSKNQDSLQFVLEESISIPQKLQKYTATDHLKQLAVLGIKTYPTKITKEHIDIIINQIVRNK